MAWAWRAAVELDDGRSHVAAPAPPRRARGSSRDEISVSDEHGAEDREAGADHERELEALGQRARHAAARALISASVRELAIEARIARPSAPPTCCDVLISPDARPASCGSTPLTAAIVIGTNAKPSPTAASSDGNRMSPT